MSARQTCGSRGDMSRPGSRRSRYTCAHFHGAFYAVHLLGEYDGGRQVIGTLSGGGRSLRLTGLGAAKSLKQGIFQRIPTSLGTHATSKNLIRRWLRSSLITQIKNFSGNFFSRNRESTFPNHGVCRTHSRLAVLATI